MFIITCLKNLSLAVILIYNLLTLSLPAFHYQEGYSKYNYILCRETLPPHLKVARQYLNTSEETGRNDGKDIEMFLNSVGRKKGDAWCAAFVSYVLERSKVKYPVVRSGLAIKFITKKSVSAVSVIQGKELPAGAIAVWKKGKGPFGHTGFVLWWKGKSGITIEGNVKPDSGIKKTDGVFIKKRTIEPLNYFRITHFTPVEY